MKQKHEKHKALFLFSGSYYIVGISILFFIACNTNTENKAAAATPSTGSSQSYKLLLNPTPGSIYHYDMNSESEFILRMNGNEVDNINNTDVTTNYTVGKDSAGNFLFNIRYDKILIHTKLNDKETDMDADNAALSINPVERILATLKEADISALVDPKGQVKKVDGYKEVGERVIAGFAADDVYSKNIARSQWEKLTEGAIAKGSMDQLFRVFPDSLITPGYTWTSESTQQGEVPLKVKSVFTLTEINSDGLATFTSKADVSSLETPVSMQGYGDVKAALKGKQTGEFQIDIQTGMVLTSKQSANIEGTLTIMGMETPVTIKNNVKVKGKKIK